MSIEDSNGRGNPEKQNESGKKPNNPVEFLDNAFIYHIEDYLTKRDHNRRWAFRLKMYSVGVAATTTVILGLGASSLFAGDKSYFGGHAIPYFSVLALIFSASITVVSSWEAFSGYDWKWIRYRTTLADLYELRDDFQIRKLAGTPVPKEEIDSFYVRLKQILRDTNTEWTRRRAPPEKQPTNADSTGVLSGKTAGAV